MVKRSPVEDWVRRYIGAQPEEDFQTAVAAYRLQALKATLHHARSQSIYYRETLKGIDPEELRRPEDLSRLPFITPEDLVLRGKEMICVPQDEIARIVTLPTSGTTGEPKRIYFTAEDQERTVDFFHHGMTTMTKPGDRVLILMPGERPGSVGDLLSRGLKRFGAEGLVHGPVVSLEETWERIRKDRPAVIVALPRQAAALVKFGLFHGFPPPPVASVLLSADYVPATVSRLLSETWGCTVHEHYGMTETCLGGGVTCDALRGYHLRDADLWFEVVSPEEDTVLPPGETGEIVVTTLTRRGMPLIRYRTGDLGRMTQAPCPCGGRLPRLDKVMGRYSKIFHFSGGGELSGAALDEVLLTLPGVIDYSMELFGEPGREVLSFHVRGLGGTVEEISRAVMSLLGGRGKPRLEVVAEYREDGFFTGALKGVFRDHRIATEACLRLLYRYCHSRETRRHCALVAAGALALAAELSPSAILSDTRFITASGLLHDIAKGRRNHDAEGARIVRDHGYTDTADYIARHTNYNPARGGFLSEEALLYLADMLLDGEASRDLEERLAETLRRYPQKEAEKPIRRRFRNAQAIGSAFLEATGKNARRIIDGLLKEEGY
ncbi:MAG: AMP-binding protein [Spirochaetales bacterium]|nr:AMP-binding protein [Spirochaetales bacterium]